MSSKGSRSGTGAAVYLGVLGFEITQRFGNGAVFLSFPPKFLGQTISHEAEDLKLHRCAG